MEGEKFMVKNLAVLVLFGCASITSYAHQKPDHKKVHTNTQSFVPTFKQYQRDVDCLISTTLREGENQDNITQNGIMHVIHNRAKRNNSSHCAVISKKNAFSHRKIKYKKPKHLIDMAIAIINDDLYDPTNGALFFHDKSLHKNPFKHTKRSAVLGDMRFYKLVGEYNV